MPIANRSRNRPRRARGRRAGPAWTPLTGLLAVLAVAALASAATFYREYQTRSVERRLEDQTTLLASDLGNRVRIPPPSPPFATARLLLADALYLAREAARQEEGPLRQRLLARAERELGEVLGSRPHWGEAWATAAYVASLQVPPQPDTERLALIRSYADAPILAKTGYWRVERSLGHWYALPPATRRRLVAEAAWLMHYGDIASRPAMFDLVRRSPAYRDIFLHWRLRTNLP